MLNIPGLTVSKFSPMDPNPCVQTPHKGLQFKLLFVPLLDFFFLRLFQLFK